MKLSIQITPEMRVRLMYAETVEIDVPDDIAVPQGWRLVPWAPDSEMMIAGASSMEEYIKDMEWDEAAMIYRAMLAAAPKYQFKSDNQANFAMMLHQRNADPIVMQYAATADLPVLTNDERAVLKELIQSRNACSTCTVDRDLLQDLSMKGALHHRADDGYEPSAAGWAMLAAAPQPDGETI